MDLKKYITVESSPSPNVWNVWFDAATAYADGALKKRPITQRESAYHIEQQADGKFVCDDDNMTIFDSQKAAEMFATAATIAYHAGK